MATALPLDDLHMEGFFPGNVTQQIVLQPVTWRTYQALLADMGEHRAARLTYDQGVLTIKMPSKLHEVINRLLERIVNVVTEELGMSVLAFGSTTLDREDLLRGVEPDSCFYVQKAPTIDPTDPHLPGSVPLDLVIEVDITSSSNVRLDVYKRLHVGEIWRYTRQGMQILQFQDGEYVPCDASPTFPMLSVQVLQQFVEQGRVSRDFNSVNRAVRAWIQTWRHQHTPE
jgi:Uma2 family endonuclease